MFTRDQIDRMIVFGSYPFGTLVGMSERSVVIRTL
jgi:hypothetical protein